MSIATAVRPTETVEPKAGPKAWLGLAVLSFAVLLIAIDATVLDLALPAISVDLAPSSVQLLWVIDVYSFVLAGLLVTMGTLGDRIGRRRLLLIGAAGFGLASLLAALSVSPEMLIAARVLQGISGATLMPATLGLIRTIFSDPRQRTMAIGVWGAMAAGGAAVGPLVGGWLLEHFWWGSVFLINAPVMVILVVVGPLVIPESKDPKPGRFDLASAGLSMLAIVPLVYAIKEFAVHGPDLILVPIAAFGLIAGTIFVRRQRTLTDPMIDLRLFANPAFSGGVVTNLLAVFALAGFLFFGSQYLQLVLGMSPLQAGLLWLPETLTTVVFSLLAAWFVRRWQPGAVLGVGLALASVGAGALLWLGTDGGVALFIGASILIGAGVGIALTLTSDLVVSSVEPERAGAASAVSETAYELGIALGVAVLGSIVMAIYRDGVDVSGVSSEAGAAARETLGSALAEGNSALAESAQAAFVSGIHVSALITAVVLAANAILIWKMLRRNSS